MMALLLTYIVVGAIVGSALALADRPSVTFNGRPVWFPRATAFFAGLLLWPYIFYRLVRP